MDPTDGDLMDIDSRTLCCVALRGRCRAGGMWSSPVELQGGLEGGQWSVCWRAPGRSMGSLNRQSLLADTTARSNLARSSEDEGALWTVTDRGRTDFCSRVDDDTNYWSLGGRTGRPGGRRLLPAGRPADDE